MTAFRALTLAQWRGVLRDKQTLFWTLAFPLMFLLLFGSIYSGGGGETSRTSLVTIGSVPLIDGLPPQARTQFDSMFDLRGSKPRQEALDEVRAGDVDAAVEMVGREVILHYSQADNVRAMTVQGTMDSYVQGANQALAGTPPTFTLRPEPVEDASLKPIQYIAPGLLGWAVAMSAMFNAAMPLVQWRINKLLRRLRLAPVSIATLIGSRTLVALVIALVQVALFLGLGVGLFHLKLTGWWWVAVLLILVGTLTFMAVGLAVGAVSKTADGASGLSNLILMPMAFLSGSFLPLAFAPDWIRTISKFLPLGHLNEGMLDLMVRGKGPESALLPAAVLIGFMIGFVALAVALFTWED